MVSILPVVLPLALFGLPQLPFQFRVAQIVLGIVGLVVARDFSDGP
jgi:hypothetical protein